KASKAAGVALLLALAIGALTWLDPAYKRERFATAIGERRDVTLADGSQLLLDSGSQIEVSWHPLSRRVALRAGQVLFEVSPARYRPFVVSAGSTDVRVLGTRFNVRRLDDDVRVTLERGRVEVGTSATAQAPVVLLPGQQVDAIGGQLMPLAKVDAATAMAWKDDRLVFERTPLGEAVALLRHYRKAPILLDDPSLASLRLTGVFAAHNVDRLLDLLPSILPVAVSRQEDGSVEIQRKSTRK
ncbi:FecR family protein, partial [Pseudomonas aeruginosa]